MRLSVLDRAAVGAPITRMGVSFFPTYLVQPDGPAILTGPDAGVTVAERPDAEVPALDATGPGGGPALLVEGQTLVGGRQTRTLGVSVLVPAGVTVEIPVNCVEQGRWGGAGDFGASRTFTSRRLRRVKQLAMVENLRERKVRRSDQGAVWAAVRDELHRLDLDSPTVSFDAVEDSFERDTGLAEASSELARLGPLPGQCGVVIAHGGRVVSAEVFGSADLLAAHWEAVVRAALLDAPGVVRGRPSPGAALRFLRGVATARPTEHDAVGLGREHHIRTTWIVAQGLTWEDRLVHASAFALAH